MCLYSTSQCLLCLLFLSIVLCCFFFFKQKTAYEMRISDWSSDVCSSDLIVDDRLLRIGSANLCNRSFGLDTECDAVLVPEDAGGRAGIADLRNALLAEHCGATVAQVADLLTEHDGRSEEHTSELQSLMRISYAVFCLKKKKNTHLSYSLHTTISLISI